METLALLGGTPVLSKQPPESLFKWPIVTQEDEDAVLDILHNNRFSGTDITKKFEQEFAKWQGTEYARAFCNGTAALTSAMYAVGLGAGDEMICTTKTYWASAVQATNLGASVVFCNIDDNLSMDPEDLERCITPNTKAIMVVHYCAYPCDMDKIMAIAKKHNLKVIEDVSHAQGGYYKGKKLGTFGDVSAMSLMSGKSFAAGELGILVTNDRVCYERAVAYGHHNFFTDNFIQECQDLMPYTNVPLGGIKGRANQLCSALALNQLKHYDERCTEIRKAMNYFWDELEGLPGIRAIRVDESTGSNMAGWYNPQGAYYPEELHGLPVNVFCEALRAEIPGVSYPGANYCLHTHGFFKTFDLFNLGKPTRIVFNDRDVREDDALCDKSLDKYCFSIPWFKQFDKEWIDIYVKAFKKVIENHEQLLDYSKDKDAKQGGRWMGMKDKA
ncbi:MAG: aminotransferase class I/II-fold pyridoxal phosphate-dependent enzyme [Oscillospiraceae bacterium]|nr:aminotransferase class I/II-fold pyridoxal phosphate-dependent enzyme [Candidatus Equicaccousia limihippi]